MLLLDEVTVDMDIVGRLDLLSFFKEECSTRGATIVYATHIFDGLETWASHLAFVANGKLQHGKFPLAWTVRYMLCVLFVLCVGPIYRQQKVWLDECSQRVFQRSRKAMEVSMPGCFPSGSESRI